MTRHLFSCTVTTAVLLFPAPKTVTDTSEKLYFKRVADAAGFGLVLVLKTTRATFISRN